MIISIIEIIPKFNILALKNIWYDNAHSKHEKITEIKDKKNDYLIFKYAYDTIGKFSIHDKKTVQKKQTDMSYITSMAKINRDTKILAGDNEGTIKLCNLDDKNFADDIASYSLGNDDVAINCICASKTKNEFYVLYNCNFVAKFFVDLENNDKDKILRKVATYKISEENEMFCDMILTEDDKYLFVGGSSRILFQFSASHLKLIQRFKFKENITTLCAAKHKKLLFIGDISGNLYVISTLNQTIIKKHIKYHHCSIWSMAVLNDKFLLSSDIEGCLRQYCISTGK